MTTDITILVQRLKVAAKNGCCHTLFPDDCLALVEALEKAQQRIAELESRTVKLPKLKMLEDYLAEVAIEERKQILVGVKLEFHRALAAAGIKVEAE